MQVRPNDSGGGSPARMKPRRVWRGARTIAFLTVVMLLIGCSSSRAPRSVPFASDRISVTVHGDGPDVILIPGLDARASDVWGGVVDKVRGYRYHVVQVAGFGGVPSGGNAGDGPVVEPIAEEVTRYISESALRKPALVGLSMGGSVAMSIAARHPEAISKVMVVDMVPFMGVFFGRPGAIASSADARDPAERTRRRMLTQSEEARRKSTADSVAAMIRTPALRQAIVEHGLESDRTVSARAMYELIQLDLRQELSRFRGPLTVLYVHAPLIPLSAEETDRLYATAFAAAPQATLKRIPDAYHFIMLDQPERFARELREFLR